MSYVLRLMTYAFYIGVFRVVHMVVIPEDYSISFKYTEHFSCDTLLHLSVKD